MEELLRQLLDWVAQNPGWAYATVFLIAMGESMAVIGVVVPGVVALVGTGALIAAGSIAFWPAFGAATAGAIVGDGLSYSLGRHFDRHIREMWPFSRYPAQLEQGVAFFERYGGWSVAFARFAGPGRAIVPLVAGMLRMPPRRFYFANVTSAIVQTFAFFLPGMLFGASLQLAAEAALRLSLLAILLVGGLWLLFWLVHRSYALLSPRANTMLRASLSWADLHGPMGRVAHALADRDRPDARTLTGLAFFLVLATFVLGLIGGAALLGVPEIGANRAALELGQGLRTPLGDRLMVLLARLGDPVAVLPMVAAVFGYLLWRDRVRHAYYWLAAAGFAILATPLLGALLRVPRPDLGLGLTLPWSFPSGPVLLATCVYGFLAISVARVLPERARWLPFALASTLVAGLAWARVYLGAEWFTDVLGSIALGLAWVSVLGLAFHRHSESEPGIGLEAAVAGLTLIAGMAVQGWVLGEAELARFASVPPVEILTHADWVTDGWRRLPARRAALRQRQRHPMTLQYAGDPMDLAAALEGSGWQQASPLDWGGALRLLSPSLPLADLPLIPQVVDGRPEAVALVKTDPDGGRRVLRLWPTRFRLAEGPPLWVGYVAGLHKASILDLIAFPATDADGGELSPEDRADLQGLVDRWPAGPGLLLLPRTLAPMPPSQGPPAASRNWVDHQQRRPRA
ncbi:MAG TPA: VTT domain-containing protein [Chromatiaceae bacterium]|nr:VTT domain-containing protein [Chromatiaceae bacterium]